MPRRLTLPEQTEICRWLDKEATEISLDLAGAAILVMESLAVANNCTLADLRPIVEPVITENEAKEKASIMKAATLLVATMRFAHPSTTTEDPEYAQECLAAGRTFVIEAEARGLGPVAIIEALR